MGEYPALIVSGNDRVDGELYEVSADHLARLDVFEGSDYERRKIELAGGGSAHSYLLREGHPARAGAKVLGRFFPRD